ncbi:YbhB/YbcL family Raf kinase inhibitor-like protein [Candidatus Roizmanbacteria bacterium]|nr:YbhB/YbcL family Raf kinase inhibitor-like protein [Candidatus Roizmanbacteria bacterium]
MYLTSNAFDQDEDIPSQYTCDGANVNPSLEFTDIPPEAKSLALIVDDPDSPTHEWSHWILFNIPPGIEEIGEGEAPVGCRIGTNDFGNREYGGPCPSEGRHRYTFKLFALDIMLDLPEGADKEAVEDAMEGHILEQAELTAHYSRD